MTDEVRYDRIVVRIPSALDGLGAIVRPVPEGENVELGEREIVLPVPAWLAVEQESLSWAQFGEFWDTAGGGVKA